MSSSSTTSSPSKSDDSSISLSSASHCSGKIPSMTSSSSSTRPKPPSTDRPHTVAPPKSNDSSCFSSSSPSYTRRLVRRAYLDPKYLTEDFDYIEWLQELYGPGVLVVDISGVPKGWVLIDGSPPLCL